MSSVRDIPHVAVRGRPGRHAATARHGPIIEHPYRWFAAAFLIWAVMVVAQQLYAGDFDLHLATIRAIVRDPLSPVDPMVGGHVGSPYFSPYMATLALASAVLGLAPETVLGAAGVANLALLLWTFRRFCRRAGDHEWLPVLALTALVLVNGRHSAAWSGFLDLTSLSYTLAYPSVFGAALLFAVWDTFLSYRAAPRRRALALLAGLGALLVLVHPFTAIEAALGLLAFLVADLRAWGPARLAWLALAAACAAAAIALWPYSNVRELFVAPANLDAIHRPLVTELTSEYGFGYFGLALAGLPALVLRRRRPMGRELIALFVLAALVVAVGVGLGASAYARVIPLAAIPLHISLAAHLVEASPSIRRPATVVYPLVAAVAVVIGLHGAEIGLRRAVPELAVAASAPWGWGHPERVRRLAFLSGRIFEADVVATDTPEVRRALTGMGAHTLAPAWPDPFIPDERARIAASRALLADGTDPAERATIADEYHVRCVVVSATSALREAGALPGFSATSASPAGVTLLCRSLERSRSGPGQTGPRHLRRDVARFRT